MRCCAFCATVSLLLLGVSSVSTSDETCTDDTSLPTQPASSLIQVRRSSEHVESALVSSRAGYVIAEDGQLETNPSGAAAPLDETGYIAVADRCCQGEMKMFIERQILELGMEVCVAAGLSGLVPYHSCEKGPQSFAALTSDLFKDSNSTCPWLAPTGECKPMNASCPSWPGSFPSPDCGCMKARAVSLDFGKAQVLHSNLGGKGPNASKPAEIRYGNIGEYPPGQPFDLVVATDEAYEGNVTVNGKHLDGPFGVISLNAAGNNGFNGKVNLQFKFFRPNGNTPVVLPEVFITFVDIDAPNSLKVKEAVSGKGFKGYVTDLNTSLAVSKADDGSTKFTSTGGTIPFLPDPMQATSAQRKAMVMYFFTDTAEFGLTISCPTDNAPNSRARWFLFTGESALVDRCGDEPATTTTEKPVTTTAKPVATTEKPVGTSEKPVGTTEKPVATTTKPVIGCAGKKDIVIAIDASKSVAFEGWEKEANFAIKLIQSITREGNPNQHALTVNYFNDDVKPIGGAGFSFNGASSVAAISKLNDRNSWNNIRKGGTDHPQVFETSRQTFSSGGRPGVDKVLILITDGVTHDGNNCGKNNPADIIKRVGSCPSANNPCSAPVKDDTRCHKQCICGLYTAKVFQDTYRLVVVGIANKNHVGESQAGLFKKLMDGMASTPADAHTADDFSDLDAIVDPLVKQLCK